MEDILAIVGIGAALVAGAMIGQFSDVAKRCELMRRLMRKDFMILALVDYVSKRIDQYIVEKNENTITYKNKTWNAKDGVYYLQSAPEKGSATPMLRNGIRVLFVRADDFIPIEIGKTKSSNATPEAVNMGLTAHAMNSAARKSLEIFKDMEKKILIGIIITVVVGLVAVMLYFGQGDLLKSCKAALEVAGNVTA